MASLNKVFLIGNITRDPELRYATSGTAVSNFSIAVNRFYTGASGERKQDTCFIRIVTWGKQAETCSRFLNKGSPVFVEGRLSSRSWTGANGEKRSTIEVVADRVQFLGRLQTKEITGTEGDIDMEPPKEEDIPAEVEEEQAGEDVPF